MLHDQSRLKSSIAPLVLLWLAVHAALLALILAIKFVSLKTMALLFLAGTAIWFLVGHKKAPALPPPPSMV
jgi:hypothetical protein